MKRFLLGLALASTAYVGALGHEPSYDKKYVAKDFNYLLGMEGFTDDALKMHFTLYQGYVKNVNLLLDLFATLDQEGKQKTPCWADMKRHFGWEFDGMRLHELYFSSLGGNGQIDKKSDLYKRIVAQWGSFEAWKKDFIDTGAMRGIGWAMLYQDPDTGRLMNFWVNEHDHGHLAGGTILLPLDVWEHAYLTDYGLDRVGYIHAFFNNIDWGIVQKRYDAANH